MRTVSEEKESVKMFAASCHAQKSIPKLIVVPILLLTYKLPAQVLTNFGLCPQSKQTAETLRFKLDLFSLFCHHLINVFTVLDLFWIRSADLWVQCVCALSKRTLAHIHQGGLGHGSFQTIKLSSASCLATALEAIWCDRKTRKIFSPWKVVWLVMVGSWLTRIIHPTLYIDSGLTNLKSTLTQFPKCVLHQELYNLVTANPS